MKAENKSANLDSDLSSNDEKNTGKSEELISYDEDEDPNLEYADMISQGGNHDFDLSKYISFEN